MLNYGVTFNHGSAEVCSPAILEIYFSYHNDTWIAVTYHVPPPGGGGHIVFAFSGIQRPESHMLSAHFKEKY